MTQLIQHTHQMGSIVTLPEYLLEEFMKKYLSDAEWRHLMNSTKSFSLKKKWTIYLQLNNTFSQQYCLNAHFRNRVLSVVLDKSKQISINLRSTPIIMSKHLHTLDGVHTLNLANNQQIDDVNMLSHISWKLDLSGCSEIKNISKLGGIHELILPRCYELRTLQGLENVVSLNLSSCHFISDVSSLSKAECLNLSNCPNVTDITPLKNVKELNLSSCPAIIGEGVNELSRVKKLDVSYCQTIETISAQLAELEILNINYCKGLKKLAQLVSLQELAMIGCKDLEMTSETLKNLRQARTVKICRCQRHLFDETHQQTKGQQEQQQEQQQQQQVQEQWTNLEITPSCLCN